MMKRVASKRNFLILTIILITAGILRFWACHFGLPGKYRPDEEYLVSRALGFHGGQLNPHFFFYPTFYMYLFSILLWIQRFFGEWFGWFEPGNFQNYLERTWHSGAHLTGRYLTAAFGTVGVYAGFILGKKAYGVKAGLFTAAILAVNFIHVRDSHFATTDVPMTTLATLAFCSILSILTASRQRDYVWAGIWTGLAISTKYAALALGFPFVTAHLLHLYREKRKPWEWGPNRDVLVYGATVLLFFFLTSPYFFLDYAQVQKDFKFQSVFLSGGLPNIEMPYSWRWLIPYALYEGAGPLVLLTAMIGLIWSIWDAFRNKRESNFTGILCFSFLLPMSLVLTKSKLLYLRYVIPYMPLLALLASRGILGMGELSRRPRLNKVLPILLLALLCADPMLRSLQTVRLMSRKDTRSMASDWIAQNLPPGTVIRVTGYPYARPDLYPGYSYREESAAELAQEQKRIWFLHHEYPIKFFSPPLRPEYITIPQTKGQQVFEASPFLAGQKEVEIFDWADAFYLPVRGFSRYSRPGPWIRIYQIN